MYRLITDAAPRSFELPGSDFFPREGVPPAADWQADLDLLRGWHRRLAGAVDRLPALPARGLDRLPGRGKFTVAELVSGTAAHDLYHAGQIQLIKRMYAHRP